MSKKLPLLAVAALVVASIGVAWLVRRDLMDLRDKPASGLQTDDDWVVYTTFYPTKYFVDRIAGDLVDAVCPVPEDEDAIFWQPPPEIIERYQEADLIVLNGAGFAKWVDKVTLPEGRLVDTAKPLADRFLRYENAVTHTHGPQGKEHSHEGLDGHTWVDPVNAKIQATEIKKALARLRPEHSSTFEIGFSGLVEELEELDRSLQGFKKRGGDRPVLASHPAYNYLAARYGWNLRNLDLDPSEMPSPETIAAIKETLEEHPARHIIWESEPEATIAAKLEEALGLRSVVFSPCELLSRADIEAGKNYMIVMRENLLALDEVFRAQ